jgi:type VI secretion system secreted protein VgrG
MAAIQTNREISVTCEQGDDVLLFRRMSGTEGLSTLSEYNLDLLSEKSDLKIDDLLGTLLTVTVDQPQGGQRYFNGFVTRFVLTGKQGRYSTYQATVRPWLWFLTRAADCRIFQDKTVVEIIKQVFEAYTIADFDVSMLAGEYAATPYCVQYRETDFNFVSRLMEDEGIYYYFKSESGRHTMVLADSYGAHQPVTGYTSVSYSPGDAALIQKSEVVFDWRMGGEIQPGSYALQAFDFEKPSTSSASLLAKSAIARTYDQSSHEIFDYPGRYAERTKGEAYAKVRIEAFHAKYQQVEAGTNARGLYPGGLFKLSDHPRTDQNKEVLIVSARYALASDDYEPTPPKEPTPVLVMEFTAIDKEHAYRPECIARKPVMQGPQTALVVGKSGEEIWTDKYGRIKVQFHWDRVRPEDETSSCWVRVAQGWAGKRWGTMFIPRIGQEVIVSFLEGDPDQPIVTGSVYNAETMPPYTLPDNATRSTIKTNSSKGGGGYNEIRFEDKKGSEQLFIHAQKDQDNRVKNDSKEWVGNNRHLMVQKNLHEQVSGARHTKVAGDHNEKVDGTVSLNSGKDIQFKSAMKYGLDAGTDIHIKAGMNVVIEAGASITLKAGGGFIVIGPVSVAVSGTPILLNGGGSAGSGGGSSPTAPEAPTAADEGT